MRALIFVFSLLFLTLSSIQAASAGDVIINEVAWMGTLSSANDEWIELYNNASSPINLDGWILKATDGTPEIKLAGSFLANGFYLLERTDDNTVPGITADQIYTSALNNKGEKLELYDNFGNLIDFIDASSGWPAGDNATKQTMERRDDRSWQTSQNAGGTPKAKNSKPAENSSPQVEDHPQPTQPSKEMAAVGEPVRQAQDNPFNAVQSKQVPILLALAVAVFSGAIILILKKGLK